MRDKWNNRLCLFFFSLFLALSDLPFGDECAVDNFVACKPVEEFPGQYLFLVHQIKDKAVLFPVYPGDFPRQFRPALAVVLFVYRVFHLSLKVINGIFHQFPSFGGPFALNPSPPTHDEEEEEEEDEGKLMNWLVGWLKSYPGRVPQTHMYELLFNLST